MEAVFSSSSVKEPLRVVIVPWLAFGHLLPYLELAERLASRGHRVTFVSTPRNLARLPPLRPATAPHVYLVALPLPRVDGLPDGAESTNDVPNDLREMHWKAFDGLAAPFAELMATVCADEGTRPHWVMADYFNHWVAASAVEHKVPCAFLLPTAAMIAMPGQLAEHLAGHAEAELAGADSVQPPRFEREAFAPCFTSDGKASGLSIMQRFSMTKERCTIAVIQSCVEWEPDWLPLLPTRLGMPVVPLGLLPPPPDIARRANGEHATVRWLETQPPGSVLYVALGSEAPLAVEQMHELALGLELAGTRFLWAVRKPSGAAVLNEDDADMLLPPGFQERTSGQGMVTTAWVPQTSILAHAAVGGFLTHCGRSSLIEGLFFGRPLVMLPIIADQGPNARQMEKRKVGFQVARDENDGSFDRHGVASAVRAVMVDGEARRGFVAAAAKMREVVADTERHERYLDEFVQHLRSYTVHGDSTAAPAHHLQL